VEAIVLPKAEEASVIAGIHRVTGDRVAVLPLIETAHGLWNVLDVARAPGVERLLFGSIDYQLDLNIVEDELLHARSQLVLASRVAGLLPPVDGVTASFDDPAIVRRDAARARSLGFGGKLCIHPRQVAETNAAFRPTADEIAWAQRVIAADAASSGAAVAVDGKMVDRPVLLRAQSILIEAELMVPI
jgi:citrate lyase subunit beta/citryl-CoA lyase